MYNNQFEKTYRMRRLGFIEGLQRSIGEQLKGETSFGEDVPKIDRTYVLGRLGTDFAHRLTEELMRDAADYNRTLPRPGPKLPVPYHLYGDTKERNETAETAVDVITGEINAFNALVIMERGRQEAAFAESVIGDLENRQQGAPVAGE